MPGSFCHITIFDDKDHNWPQVKHGFNEEFWNWIIKFPWDMRNWSPTSKLWVIHPSYINRVITRAQHTFNIVILTENNVAKQLITYHHEAVEPSIKKKSQQPALF